MNTKTSVTLASASALAAGITQGFAQGSIIYSGRLNLQQTYDAANYRQPIDMTGDGVPDFTFGYDGNNLKPYVDTRTNVSGTIPVQSGIVNLFEKPGSKGLPVTLAGTMIDASYAAAYPVNFQRGYMYQDDTQTVAGDWSNTAVTEGYVGIELALAGGEHYGWLHFIDDPVSNPNSLTLVDWAYESDPNVGIETGMVPEPSVFALAGLGCAALLLRRKRQ
jgi:PEP-CTERM motif